MEFRFHRYDPHGRWRVRGAAVHLTRGSKRQGEFANPSPDHIRIQHRSTGAGATPTPRKHSCFSLIHTFCMFLQCASHSYNEFILCCFALLLYNTE